MVSVQVHHLVSELKCNSSCYTATTLFDGKSFNVTEFMEAELPMTDGLVFFMVNGANDDVYVSCNGQFECVGQAIQLMIGFNHCFGADFHHSKQAIDLK
ncbi:hypothetical protein P3T76_012941 [Phytophthora citrophthora]|uniref:Uncharacterized protein n=1 Tax=Phytophthora citrophthora TaxID=4793 RepID=A0AAD9LDH0_9STRA|nr:hypothetical protein P3T76_012941 [Phytophthora citrophthora]